MRRKQHRIKLLPGLTVWLALSAFLLGVPGQPGKELRAEDGGPPYDIVLIITDDQRADTIQYMPLTKALLADQGVTFTNFLVSNPLCCPSRATVLTGQYSHNTRVFSNGAPLGGATVFDDTSTIATWLSSAGYRTGLFGKYLNEYPNLTPWPYVPPGWHDWRALPGGYYGYTLVENGIEVAYGRSRADYSTTVLKNKAVQFIHSIPSGQPFFVYFAPFAPHTAMSTTLDGFPTPVPAREDINTFSGLAPWRPPSYNEADVSDKPRYIKRIAPFTATQMSRGDLFRQRQIESLQEVDRAVAALVDALTTTGRIDNTVLIYTSDNGLSWGEHRWLNQKNCTYEECIRAPLLIRAPGVGPRVEDSLTTNIDLAPSIAEWAGAIPPTFVNGLSLAPLLADPTIAWRDAVLIEVLGRSNTNLSAPGNSYAVRTQQYLYAEYMNGFKELYDLTVDPYQLTNVINQPQYASVVASLKAKLDVLKAQ